MARRNRDFEAIRSEGGLLPPDLLRRILDPREKLPGTNPEDYGLPRGERLNEIITQSWNRLRKHWADFLKDRAKLAETDPGTGLTNERWSLPLLRELGFGTLPTGPGPEINGRSYAISRFSGPTPVHLVGCNLSLDRRAAGVRGAAAANPHGLVQEFLNRSRRGLWGIVSNGLRLRILRDSQALSRQSFLEFDLESIFDGENYSDFVLLWLVAHASRFDPREADRPETCWLEEWTKIAQQEGTRALGELRIGVEKALQVLGEGFTGHPRNTALRDALRTGRLSPADLHGQLLRVIYRLIFLFVAEDRVLPDDGLPLLHPRDGSEEARRARERYAAHYGTARLRELAGRIKGSRHGDLWRQFQLIVRALSGDPGSEAARAMLALPSLGSMLWDPNATADLNEAELTNHDFLEMLRHLAFTRQGKVLRPVDYRNLGAEELGGVYESLLALSPQVSADGARFTFAEFAGSERKMSGSYYTPDSLVQCLLDSALDPVVEEAIRGKSGEEAEKAILSLRVCDPAVGSGHFLVGAAHRLARHLARVRSLAQGESEPSTLAYRQALRDVIGRCLYGVDVNPMAAELCRVSLWLEALEPGKPLSFLDHQIQVGNSLLGTTPELIAGGLPDEAFSPIEGDDKKISSAIKKRNRQERESGQTDMLHQMVAETREEFGSLEKRFRELAAAPDGTLEDVGRKAEQFSRLVVSKEYRHAQLVADAWCAAFVWKKAPGASEPITTDILRRLQENPTALATEQAKEVERLASRYRFFHWHLAFPEVFADGGFDCVLSNPPWEHTELKEKEWFAERRPDIANARTGAERKRMIDSLKKDDADLFRAFSEALREHDGISHFLGNSGRYPLCGRGRINYYAVFAEGMRSLLNDRGLMGAVLPTGIATDDTTKFFFQDVVGRKSLVSLYDFENKLLLFPDVAPPQKFCLFTAGRELKPSAEMAEFAFFLHAVEDLEDPERRFSLSPEDIELLNPNTRTCPIFRSRRDAELTKAIYRRVPVLIREARDGRPEENPWGIKFKQGLFNMTSDSHLFRTREQLEADGWVLEGNVFRKDGEEYLPLYEPKLFHQFNHRYNSFEKVDRDSLFNVKAFTPEMDVSDLIMPDVYPLPRYWVKRVDVDALFPGGSPTAIIAFRNIINVSTNRRTSVFAMLPMVAANHAVQIITTNLPMKNTAALIAALNSFPFDYCARQKLGGSNFSFFIMKQLPALSPSRFELEAVWCGDSRPTSRIVECLLPHVLELIYTAWDLESFAKDCGWNGPPFRWDEERRFLLRCELDAAFFHLYLPATPDGHWKPARLAEGAVRDETPAELAELKKHFLTPRDAVAYIMDTFPIVRRKDEEKYGDYRTKRVILEIYDEMAEAIRTGRPYQTRLDPPPADPRCCHPPRTH
ncbi:MAG: N-6 DNA methylase [Syntrophaceae bacterium]|nr:N-6 DNA methylase [Syntrophaceae bacterium]